MAVTHAKIMLYKLRCCCKVADCIYVVNEAATDAGLNMNPIRSNCTYTVPVNIFHPLVNWLKTKKSISVLNGC